MTVRTFTSILSHDLLNNNYRNLLKENVKMIIPFLPGPLSGDPGSFETNHPPAPTSCRIDMAGMIACGSCLYLSSVSGGSSKHTRKMFSIVISQDGKKK